ncbi:MAG: hypothetical protein KTR15_09200 [Phycisphaeraceae bacterium]|nr:hypothetical protein [Phycisphaeraceae bacterium]
MSDGYGAIKSELLALENPVPLSPEAETVFRDAQMAMVDWIDRSANYIGQKARASLEEARQEIETESEQLKKQQEEDQQQLQKAIDELNNLGSMVELPDISKIKEQIEQVRSKAEAVKKHLDDREKKWRGMGQAAVKAVSTAIKAI